jgi:hypothetical protein
MRILIAAALVGFSCSTVAVANEPVEDKVICKRQYANDTGSNFQSSKRVCLKKSEWKAQEDETQTTVRKMNEGGAARQSEFAPTSGGPN